MTEWINDPQEREEVEKVTKELKLPIYKPSAKGKFRPWLSECWEKIENHILKIKSDIKDFKLTWDSITDKPSTFAPSEHNHDDLYSKLNETNIKFNESILYSTGKEYGGILNEIGNKIPGKTYFDKNTNKLFLCKKENTDISANAENFVPIDNNSNYERFENFFSFQEINSEPLVININNPIRKFKIPDCKFIMVEVDLYSNDPKLYSKTTKVIPYSALKAGKKFYHSDNTSNYEISEIWLSGNELNIISVTKTAIYVGEIFTI